ncbi:hypothetical protein SDRG_03744 [Saprolegnia diclina VS20]|uniref:Apple domain-containing protein n=1 Tax=Saprolegnia diclina (strain VS20) TaxID=1156394 RepID=T0QXJ0_SAPDV|nr:hypothetical protein SDRG_03744 [Saprolegnia diclina VS20]EQC38785.1 hypothetical protein SDRG_03744 [Saprolegnia diclina VS20]|eukprot:XP_008607609.1 hypothetical protein SDRG_03744 [Saprolegnia diclina VS20]
MRVLLSLTTLLGLAMADIYTGKASLNGPADGMDPSSGNCGLMDALPTARQFQVAMNLDHPTPTVAPVSPAPTPVARACGAPEWNMDMFGNDVANFKAQGEFTAMLAQCCEGCKVHEKCAAVTLSDGVCYLKSAVGNRQTKNGATSVAMTTM